jgi:hypothetical protein
MNSSVYTHETLSHAPQSMPQPIEIVAAPDHVTRLSQPQQWPCSFSQQPHSTAGCKEQSTPS